MTASNSSAREFWGAEDLGGRPFCSLFTWEVVSEDPEFLEAQWEAIRASATDAWFPLAASGPAGTAPRPVRVRLERHLGGPAGYLASVTAAPAIPLAEAAAAPVLGGSAFTLLVDSGFLGLFDLDLKAGRVVLSPGWKKMLGYAPSEIPDTLDAWRHLLHPDDSGAAPDRVGRKPAAGPRPISVEYRMRHGRGHWVWIHCLGLQLVGAQGQVERVVGLHLDIAERKELEEALVASEARLEGLSGDGPLAAFELDFGHGAFWFSAAWERLLGYEEGELPRTLDSFAAAMPPADAPAGVVEWLTHRSPGETVFIEPVRLRTKHGASLPVLLGASRAFSRKRELQRVVGFACPLPSDQAAGGGAWSTLLAEGALDTVAEGVLICDPRGQLLLANRAAARQLGIDPASAVGRKLGEVFRLVTRQDGRPADNPLDAALQASQPLPLISTDALASPGDGRPPTPIIWTARAATAPDGQAQGVTVVFRNPDEMSLTPDELVKANRFESLGLLAGGIAHDFNNLLTTILGAVSLAKDNRDYSALGDAEQACLVAKGLTRQLLAFAKGSVNQRAVCSVAELLEDSVKIAAPDSNAVVTIDVPAETENVMVDRAQMLQVFQNLIVNALQAMPPAPHQPQLQLRAGNLVLADGQVPDLGAGVYVSIEVRDNGSGIKPEVIEKIFDSFFTTKKHGTGLGLATVLSLVRRHAGQVTVDSAVGLGTVFTVYLPRAEQAPDARARRAPSLRVGTGRVLFMDDDPKIAELTGAMLEILGYKFDLARKGEEAITLYRRYLNLGRPYDAVILDLTIVGGMGGEQCFEELRQLDPDVRAIVASGYDNDDIVRQYLDKGFCGFLTKPYRGEDLGKTLKTVLG